MVLKVHDGACRRHGPSYSLHGLAPRAPQGTGLGLPCARAPSRDGGSPCPVVVMALSSPDISICWRCLLGPFSLLSCSSPDSPLLKMFASEGCLGRRYAGFWGLSKSQPFGSWFPGGSRIHAAGLPRSHKDRLCPGADCGPGLAGGTP